MYIRNVTGSSRFAKPRGYSSWLDYWVTQARQVAYFCPACGNSADIVGAHVQKAYSGDNRWYIVPLCSSCNKRTDTFNVSATLVPVPSNL